MQETLDLHIAGDRRAALAEGRALPSVARGSVLFADIASFSRLTGDLLDAAGPSRGAEELTRALDEVYDALIGCVDAFGGAVVTFSGDAITCFFPDDDGLRAASAAEAMMRAASAVAVSVSASDHRPIKLKVGLAHGAVRRAAPGDPEVQRIDVLAGEPVMDAARAERCAEPGDTVLAPSMRAQLERRFTPGDARDGGCVVMRALASPAPPLPWPDIAPLDRAAAEPWTLAAVRGAIASGTAGFLAELRTAVSLFMRFSGIDFSNDPEAEDRLDLLVRWTQKTLGAFGGSLLGVTFGDKGSYLNGAFGAPTSFEDDCSRAAAAALALHDRPPELDFVRDVGVGLCRGRMRAGTLGGRSRRTYAVLGNDANIAARLMERAAAGEVLAGAQVAVGAARTHMFQSLGAMTVKGRHAPFHVLRCTGRRTHDHRHDLPTDEGPIAGRADLLAAFERALDDLDGGRGGALLLTGEGGIGKSRLLRAFMEIAARRGRGCHLAAAEAIEQSTAYHAWRPAMSGALGLREVTGDERAIREHVRARVARRAPAELAPLLSAVLPVPYPDSDRTRALSSEVRADATRDLMTAVLLPPEGRAPVVFVDNAHWLDSASWALLARLRAERPDLLVVVTTRPLDTDRIPRELTRLTEHPATRRVTLGALDRDALAALVRGRLAGLDVDEAVIDFIHQRTSGHPFFAEELAHAYLERNPPDSGFRRRRVVLEDFAATDFPATVEGVVTSRLDRLPPELLLALKVASVLGTSFHAETLVAIHPDVPAATALATALERMCERGVLVREGAAGGFAFRHAILQRVTYDRMLFAQRRELHADAARWYERAHAEALDRHYAVLAHHHEQAEDLDAAVRCLDRAAAHAVRQGAYDEAIRFVDRVTALDPEGLRGGAEQRVRRLRILGEAQQCMGQIRESRAALERSLVEQGRSMPETQAGVVARAGMEVVRQTLHRLAPPLFVRRAPDAEGRAFAAQVLRDLQPAYFLHNALIHMAYATLRAVNLAEGAAGIPLADQVRAEGYAATALIASAVGAERVAEGYRRRALETGKAAGDDTALGQVWLLLALHSTGIGQCARAYEEASEARELFARSGHRRRFEIARGTMGWTSGYVGRFEDGLAAWHDVRKAALQRGDRQSIAQSHAGLAEALLTRGRADDLDEAGRWTATALEQIALGQDHMFDIHALGLRGVIAARRGQLAEALADFERAVGEMEASVPLSGYAMAAYARPAEAMLDLADEGRVDARHPLVTRSAGALARFGRSFSLGVPRAVREQGRLLALLGSRARARRLLAEAAERASALGLAVDAARARIDLARLDGGRGALERAVAEAGRLGLVYQPALLARGLGARGR